MVDGQTTDMGRGDVGNTIPSTGGKIPSFRLDNNLAVLGADVEDCVSDCGDNGRLLLDLLECLSISL